LPKDGFNHFLEPLPLLSHTMKVIKQLSLLILFLAFINVADAQTVIVKGHLRDSLTHYPIVNGSITNWNSRKKAATNANGFFFIEATANDRLHIQSPTYQSDTLQVPPLLADTIIIYLAPTGSILEGVTVQSSYTKYQLDSMRRRENFLALRGSRIQLVGTPPPNGFGLNLSLDRLFKSKYKQQKKQEDQFKEAEQQQYIAYRFSPQLVATITGLKGDTLRDFMYRYTPGYGWLRLHPTQQELLLYINDKLKQYKNNK
jgi:hypothetical protein